MAATRKPLSHKDLGQTGRAGFDASLYGVSTYGKYCKYCAKL